MPEPTAARASRNDLLDRVITDLDRARSLLAEMRRGEAVAPRPVEAAGGPGGSPEVAALGIDNTDTALGPEQKRDLDAGR